MTRSFLTGVCINLPDDIYRKRVRTLNALLVIEENKCYNIIWFFLALFCSYVLPGRIWSELEAFMAILWPVIFLIPLRVCSLTPALSLFIWNVFEPFLPDALSRFSAAPIEERALETLFLNERIKSAVRSGMENVTAVYGFEAAHNGLFIKTEKGVFFFPVAHIRRSDLDSIEINVLASEARIPEKSVFETRF